MLKNISEGISSVIRKQQLKFRKDFSNLFFAGFAGALLLTGGAGVQAATINNVWWSYQQDCNGDGAYAGQLAGNLARLNWTPVVANCSGNVVVYEILYFKTCDSSTWTPFFTNPSHEISGCSINNSQYFDVPMDSNGACYDYKIEIYKNGSGPDFTATPAAFPALSQHREEQLSQDFCLSDYFASGAVVTGATGSRLDDNTFATKEPGEPNHAGNAGGKSLWYEWTAPANKSVTFDTLGSSFDTVLAVYTGNSISNLTMRGTNDDISGASNRFSRVTFTPTTGTTYHIAVDGFGGASGLVQLNWNQTGGSLPDLVIWGPTVASSLYIITNNFTNGACEVVEGCETVGTHTLLSFTTETRNIGTGDLIMGDPATNILFHWATCHAHYHFEQFASYSLVNTNELDPDGNPTLVASGHKVGFCLEDVIKWDTSRNTGVRYDCTHQGIQAGWADIYYGYHYYAPPNDTGLPCQYIDITDVAPGDYVLQLIINPDNVIPESDTNNNVTLVPVTIPPSSCSSVPTNNAFGKAALVDYIPFTYSEPNQCCNKQGSEPNHAGNAGGHSVWFKWTPDTSQTVVVNTKGSTFDTVVAVYTGNTVSSLTAIASNDDFITGTFKQSQLSFAANAGTTYYIAVDGFGGAVGNVILNIAPPGNDDFQNALVVQGTSGSVNGYNVAGSKQPYELAHAGDVGGHSLWFLWTAPSNGPVDFNTGGSTFDTTMAVYTNGMLVATNGALTNFVTVAANHIDPEEPGTFGSRVDFTAVAGRTYQIAVDGFGGATGNTQLNWNMDSQVFITKMLNGDVALTLTGVDWQRYTIMGSTNLVNWTTNVPAITMSHGIHQYGDFTPTTNGPVHWYYRGHLN